jgi:Protein of unknown function (DUF2924)
MSHQSEKSVSTQGCLTAMPRSSFDGEAIEAEIDHIRSLGLDELRNLWRATFRAAPPPGFTKDLIARFLSWHIQEQAFGGLDSERQHACDGCKEVAPVKACRQALSPPLDVPAARLSGTALDQRKQAIAGADIPAAVGLENNGRPRGWRGN